MSPAGPLVLLTGATGYVGGRLLHRLEREGRRVRCLTRRPEHLEARCAPGTEVVAGDVLRPETLDRAMEGVDTAFYLVHSMGGTEDFRRADRRGARAFAAAARRAGVRRIVYLGGLGAGPDLSGHLSSRQEVGRILRESGVPTLEFRASIIIGSGSFSFEMVRALVDRLPAMVTPRWVDTPTQPIAIEDVVEYLARAVDIDLEGSAVFEIGGEDRVSYGDLMREYARQRGLRRLMVRVPVLTPRLSSLWLGLVTPVYARIGRELVDGLRNPTVVGDESAREVFGVRPRGIRDQIARALANEDREFAETRWSDALSSGREPRQWGGTRFGTRMVDARSVFVPVPPATAFTPIRRIGGRTGWYYGDWLWHARGFLDLLARGPGLRRGRRDPEHLAAGDTVDFWRVEEVEEARLLRLRAEMRLPGRAWLQFEVRPVPSGSMIHQTALFDPVGLSGRLYWFGVWPLHRFVFSGMLRNIARAARREGLRRGARAAGRPPAAAGRRGP